MAGIRKSKEEATVLTKLQEKELKKVKFVQKKHNLKTQGQSVAQIIKEYEIK